MAALQGTILASKIVPTDSLDTYATHEDKYGRGGHRSVDTLEERDNITAPRRKEGMTVYVKENKTKYILESGIENVNWKVDSSGGSSGGSVDLSDYYKKTETYSKAEVNTKIADIPPTDLTNYYNKAQVDAIALDKVDKVAGKQLSTEDYTTAEKTKLTGLSNYTKPASEPISYITGLQTALDSKVSKTGVETLHSTDALRISGTTLSLYKGDGTFESVETQDTVYTLPKASETVLGGIKVGTNLSIDANGVLSANDTNVSFTEISNKPTNLSGYGITDAYTKTQVDSLIPNISTKQDVLVSGTNIKTINGESVLGSGDIVISSGGSGSSTFTGTAAIDIGGVKVGDSWNNASISDVVNAIINPELFPAFVNPTFSFTSTVNGFREVGSVTDITFNVNFSRGSITPQYSAENNYRSGLPTTYNYSGPVGSEAKANNTLTDTKTITGYSIAIGNNTFSCSVDYSIGTQPKSSKGNDYNTPLPAGTLAAKSVTITGVYPVYNGIGTLSKIPLQAHGTAIVVDAPADMNVGGERFKIQYPAVWSAKTPVVQQENELSKAWDNQNMSDYSITTIDKNGVSYKQVEYIGAGIGARKLRLVF